LLHYGSDGLQYAQDEAACLLHSALSSAERPQDVKNRLDRDRFPTWEKQSPV
jgi:hypothetical protein